MAAPASTPPLDQWASLLTGDPQADLQAAIDRSPTLAALVRPSFARMPALRTGIQGDSGVYAEGDAIALTVTVIWRDTNRARFGTASFSLFSDDHTCQWNDLQLDYNYQGAGFGTQYLATLIELCGELGIRTILIYANQVGRYTWARAGFEFASEDDRERVVEGARVFAAKLGVRLPIDLDRVRQPSEIANLIEPVTLSAFAAATGAEEPEASAQTMTLGQALLLGPGDNTWYGQLEITS
jgi:GNAT superfamily N-acetyltransferase